MKALSIRQPWAWMILNAGKDIENREWCTGLRGRILIHASKGMTAEEWDYAWNYSPSPRHPNPCPMVSFDTIPRGGIVGSVEIVDCVRRHPSSWFFGPYGFVLRNPIVLPFIPCRGQLNFFDVPEDVEQYALAMLKKSTKPGNQKEAGI